MATSVKVLVTGGLGYIGSHTCIELMQQGHEVLIIDDLSNTRREVLDGIAAISGKRPYFEQFDLCEEEKLDYFFKSNPDIGAVIHFAASKAVGESVADPLKYYRNNLFSLVNLLGGMRRYNLPNLVFSSSCTVYGQPEILPVTENSPVKPAESPYGNTKQISEEIIRDTIRAHPQLRAIALRYFNPVGAHPSAHIGELPLGVPNNLVPFITQTAAGIREVLNVFGSDYDTPDGSAIRDYIHVVDLAQAHVAALDRMLKGAQRIGYEVFNLGTGKGYSVLEVIAAFERVTGLKLNHRITGRRPGDIEKVWADTTLANRELGWKAEKGLDEMMASAWNWQQHLAVKT